MSLEPPNMPDKFDWPNLKGILDDWFIRLLRGQNFVPSGTITEYAGTTAPDGWVESDGTEYEIARFPALFKVIGVESTPGNFVVPTPASAPVAGQIWIIKV